MSFRSTQHNHAASVALACGTQHGMHERRACLGGVRCGVKAPHKQCAIGSNAFSYALLPYCEFHKVSFKKIPLFQRSASASPEQSNASIKHCDVCLNSALRPSMSKLAKMDNTFRDCTVDCLFQLHTIAHIAFLHATLQSSTRTRM